MTHIMAMEATLRDIQNFRGAALDYSRQSAELYDEKSHKGETKYRNWKAGDIEKLIEVHWATISHQIDIPFPYIAYSDKLPHAGGTYSDVGRFSAAGKTIFINPSKQLDYDDLEGQNGFPISAEDCPLGTFTHELRHLQQFHEGWYHNTGYGIGFWKGRPFDLTAPEKNYIRYRAQPHEVDANTTTAEVYRTILKKRIDQFEA